MHTVIKYFQMHKPRLILAVDCHGVIKRRKVFVILVYKMAKWNVQTISASDLKMDSSASDSKDVVTTSGKWSIAIYLKVAEKISLHWSCMYMF